MIMHAITNKSKHQLIKNANKMKMQNIERESLTYHS